MRRTFAVLLSILLIALVSMGSNSPPIYEVNKASSVLTIDDINLDVITLEKENENVYAYKMIGGDVLLHSCKQFNLNLNLYTKTFLLNCENNSNRSTYISLIKIYRVDNIYNKPRDKLVLSLSTHNN